ncbi:MAG: ATP-dependent DNA ligase, partial [Bacteroidota bacterium]
DLTNKTNAKIAALVAFFEVAPDEDKIWAMALFSGRRPRRAVKTTLLREWTSEMTGIPLWLVEDSYHVVGDLAETLAMLLPPPEADRTERSLADWMDYLAALKPMDDLEKREHLMEAWSQLSAQERFVFNKLITGGFRLGVSQKLLVRALSKHTGLEQNAIAHRLMGNWTPGTTNYQELLFSDDVRDDISKPYPFYLAYALETEPIELGEPTEWQAEWKWDGIRSQTIKRDGQWFLWSRGEELITEKFPDLEEMALGLPDGTVIDGELLPYKEGRPLSFQILQTRIGRKNVTKKILESCPVIIMAYDLMEWEGEDVRHWPMQKRREKLVE